MPREQALRALIPSALQRESVVMIPTSPTIQRAVIELADQPQVVNAHVRRVLIELKLARASKAPYRTIQLTPRGLVVARLLKTMTEAPQHE